MNVDRVVEIARACTRVFAKPAGERVETEERDEELGAIVVGVPSLVPAELGVDDVLVDAHFVFVRVDAAALEKHREELALELLAYEEPDRLALGLSYLEVSRVVGSNDAAMRLFACGQVLGFWDVVVPASLGFSGEQAEELARQGMIMTTGFRP